jgi:hypothetical protein
VNTDACRHQCHPDNSAVVFLRKKSGQVKFVEQGFMQNLLMWWNDGLGADTIHMESALKKRTTNVNKRPPRSLEQTGSRDGEQVDGIAGMSIQNRLSHHGKHPPFQTAS